MLDQNLYTCFQQRRPADPAALFLRGDRRSLSYGDLDIETGRYAAVLEARGVTPGDRVVVQVGKSVEFVLLYLACLRAGAVFVPLNPAYTRAELAYFLGDASPRVLVCDPAAAAAHDLPALAAETGVAHCLTLGTDGGGSLPEAAAALPPATGVVSRGRDDLAAILYTSGTTGRSKGAMITHGNLISNGLVLHEYWGWAPGDVLLHALPVFHVHGLFVALHCALLNGSEVIFLDAFDPARLVAELPGASVLMGVPTFYVRLLDTPGFDRSVSDGVRLFISGSAPLLPETFDQFAALTGKPILERYGMTEAGMITSNPYAGGSGSRARSASPCRGSARGSPTRRARRCQRARSAFWRSPAPTSSPATGTCRRRRRRSSAPTATSSPAIWRPWPKTGASPSSAAPRT